MSGSSDPGARTRSGRGRSGQGVGQGSQETGAAAGDRPGRGGTGRHPYQIAGLNDRWAQLADGDQEQDGDQELTGAQPAGAAGRRQPMETRTGRRRATTGWIWAGSRQRTTGPDTR
jgi:hypothetical protein